MLSAESRMDELAAAYIGLIDLYGEILNTEEKSAMPYTELSNIATRMLLSSLGEITYQEKMSFCLKASAWLGVQQLHYVNRRSQYDRSYKLEGIDDIKSSLLRSL